jgi:acyl-CoA thioester hydrolase
LAGEITTFTKIRVRYADTDKMGIVYYSNYLIYFEVGRTEFIREIWKPYSELERAGYILLVLSAEIHYNNSAIYDDMLTIETTLAEFNRVRLKFNYKIYRQGHILIATGATEHCFSYQNGKPRRMPQELWEILQKKCNSANLNKD